MKVPYGYYITDEKFSEVYQWCVDTFGHDHDDKWYFEIQPLYAPEFVFIEEKDAAIFALKWQ